MGHVALFGSAVRLTFISSKFGGRDTGFVLLKGAEL